MPEFIDTNILLVEDDLNVRMTVRSMLTEMGVKNIFEKKDGQEALTFVENMQVRLDLIICDWNMPHKTGLEFLREIKQSYPEILFLMITARNDEDSVLTAKEANVSAYIRKPFSFEELKTKVQTLLKK